MWVVWILTGVTLVIGSIYDMKSLALPLWLFIASGVCSLVSVGYQWTKGIFVWEELPVALLPGGICLLLGFVTREQIGYGDGLLLLNLGVGLGASAIWELWMMGLLASFVASVVLLCSRRAKKSFRIPFLPFLCLGYVWVVIGGMRL